jgi:hypothetical protein
MTSLTYLLSIRYEKLLPSGSYSIHISPATESRQSGILKKAFPFLSAAFASLHGQSDALPKYQLAEVDSLLTQLFHPRMTSPRWLEIRAVVTEADDEFHPFWIIEPGIEVNVVLGLASCFRRPGITSKVLEMYPDTLVGQRKVKIEAKYLNSWVQRWEATYIEEEDDVDVWLPQGSPLHVALGFDCVQSVKIILRHTRNIRQLDQMGEMPLLSLALRAGQYLSTFCGNERDALLAHQYLDLLLEAGANVNPHGVSETPLQTAARLGDHYAISKLLSAGANVNGVADDRTVMESIRRQCEGKQQDLPEMLRIRGLRHFYMTPLRLLLNLVAEKLSTADECGGEQPREREELEDAITLLITHGGLDLCLFPHEDLPGHEEECWQRYNGIQRRVRRRES